MSQLTSLRLSKVEAACAQAYGSREVFPWDPYDHVIPLTYKQYGDLGREYVHQILFETANYCSVDSLRRILPELLKEVNEALISEGELSEDGVGASHARTVPSAFYSLLRKRQLLEDGCELSVRDAAEEFICDEIAALMKADGARLTRSFRAGGCNRFILHFNSCGAGLPSIERLWKAWWALSELGAFRHALWFVYTLCGDAITADCDIIDTRWLSSHMCDVVTGEGRLWSDATRLFLLEVVDWEDLIARLISRGEEFGEEALCAAWPIVRRMASMPRQVEAIVSARFVKYVQRMASNQFEFAAWQVIE